MSQMTMYEGINNSPITVLDGDLSASATTIPVVAGSAFPAPPSLCTIGTEENAELVLYTGISNSQLTGCTRGFNGTTAKAWADGTSVYRAISEYDQQAIQHNIRDHEERMAQTEQSMRSAASAVYGTGTGNPAVIPDAAGERVLRNMKVHIEPVQSGSGDPAPDNVRTVTGWTAAKVTRCGKNLMPTPYDVQKPAGYSGTWNGTSVDENGIVTQQDYNFGRGGFGGVVVYGVPAGTYTVSFDADYTDVSNAKCAVSVVVRYRDTQTNKSLYSNGQITDARPSVAFTLDSYAEWVAVRVTSGAGSTSASVFRYTNIQLESGAAATPYEPYTGDTYNIAFPVGTGTVYGGTLDVTSGTLTVDRAYRSFNGTEDWKKVGSTTAAYFRLRVGEFGSVVNDSGICSHFVPAVIGSSTTGSGQRVANSSASGIAAVFIRPDGAADMSETDFKAWLAAENAAEHPVQIVYKLAASAVFGLNPVQIAALTGENIVFADCGPVEADYVQDTGAAIEEANASTRAMIAEASGVTASRSLAVGEYVAVGDKLYKVTSAVGAGETLVPGSNVTETTVGAELTALYNLINS